MSLYMSFLGLMLSYILFQYLLTDSHTALASCWVVQIFICNLLSIASTFPWVSLVLMSFIKWCSSVRVSAIQIQNLLISTRIVLSGFWLILWVIITALLFVCLSFPLTSTCCQYLSWRDGLTFPTCHFMLPFSLVLEFIPLLLAMTIWVHRCSIRLLSTFH